MKFVSFTKDGRRGLAVANGSGVFHGLMEDAPTYPGDLDALIATGENALADAASVLAKGETIDTANIRYELPLRAPGKILCVGLNYADHSAESGMTTPDFPTVFARFVTSMVPHDGALIRPKVSTSFDYEGELVAVIGKTGRHIREDEALSHIVGYSLFNDGSVRDYQLRTPQWTVGKNFDSTGAFGPWLVTADELPQGATGLNIKTTLNGQVVQEASTDDLFFSVAKLVSLLSVAMTLEPGDIIVTGTPAGVGAARNPPLFMKPGDICEVEVEGIGRLSNRVADEN